jgi:hypothetical protein
MIYAKLDIIEFGHVADHPTSSFYSYPFREHCKHFRTLTRLDPFHKFSVVIYDYDATKSHFIRSSEAKHENARRSRVKTCIEAAIKRHYSNISHAKWRERASSGTDFSTCEKQQLTRPPISRQRENSPMTLFSPVRIFLLLCFAS